jgi:hypothetical protein
MYAVRVHSRRWLQGVKVGSLLLGRAQQLHCLLLMVWLAYIAMQQLAAQLACLRVVLLCWLHLLLRSVLLRVTMSP